MGPGPSPADFAYQSHLIHLRTKSAYFASLKLMENDAEIIEYLAEVIKTQQSEEVRTNKTAFDSFFSLQCLDLLSLSQSPSSAAPAPVSTASSVRLDFAATRKYKNMVLG